MIKFTIHGQIRGGKNTMRVNRYGQHYPEKKWAAWRDHVVADLRHWLVGQGHRLIDFPCILRVNYWPGDLKCRDVPAMLDSLFHCFEKAGLIRDDSLFQNVGWRNKGLDRKNPRTEVEIEEI